MAYWLMKSEPDVYSIADLRRDRQTLWEGVRNYQARNFLRQMVVGDFVFFYHSNTSVPVIVGLMKVIEGNAIDPTQFDRESPYYDPRSTLAAPRWWTVKVEFLEEFSQFLSLESLREKFSPDRLLLVRKGNRLSVLPVELEIARKILAWVE
jgi:predicted RNA-binding protein with PUA-like domain